MRSHFETSLLPFSASSGVNFHCMDSLHFKGIILVLIDEPTSIAVLCLLEQYCGKLATVGKSRGNKSTLVVGATTPSSDFHLFLFQKAILGNERGVTLGQKTIARGSLLRTSAQRALLSTHLASAGRLTTSGVSQT